MFMLLFSHAETSPGEKEDIDLLERALEKALRVRTGSEPSKDIFYRSNLSGAQSETSLTTDVLISSAVANGGQTTLRSASKSASFGRKEYKKSDLSPSTSYKPTMSKSVKNRNAIQNSFSSSARAVHQRASRKFQQTVSASASPDPITAPLVNKKTARSNVARSDDRRAAAVSVPSSNDTDGFGLSSLLQQNRYVLHGSAHKNNNHALFVYNRIINKKILNLLFGRLKSEETTKWKYLRSKQNGY